MRGLVEVVVVLMCSAALAGCGDDDGSAATATSTTATSTVADPAPTTSTTSVAAPAGERTTVDRPDDDPGEAQVQVLYLTASDGPDHGLDTDGTLVASVESTMRWLEGETGRRVRFDTYEGELDIVFHRLPRSSDEYFAEDVFIRDAIEADLIAAGFDDADTIYAAYYAGPAVDCASAFNPETLPGNTIVSYWAHVGPGEADCVVEDFAGADDPPGTWEFGLVHELFHAFGAVATCAPNHFEGHVGDFPFDLMYRGDEPWVPSVIDVDNDDYFGHGDPDCTDVALSPHLLE